MHIKIKGNTESQKEVVVPIIGLMLKKFRKNKEEFVFSAYSSLFNCDIDEAEYNRLSDALCNQAVLIPHEGKVK